MLIRKFLLSTLVLMTGLSIGLPSTQNVSASNRVWKRINYQVKHMPISQKIGQCVMAKLSDSNSRADYYIRKYHLGGVILEGASFEHIPTRARFINHIKSMQRSSHNTLLVAADQEGGIVDRLALNHRIFRGHYLSPRQDYKKGGMRYVQDRYESESYALKRLGFNLNLAPVLGMPGPYNLLYPRGMFRNAYKQSWYARRAILGIQGRNFNTGVAATAKHFPGFTHENNTDVADGYTSEHLKAMRNYNFRPFESAIKTGVGVIMTSFIDPYHITGHTPVVFSRYMVNIVLKKQLGYKGVILTDALNTYPSTQYGHRHHRSSEYLALKAGNTMIMTTHPRTVGPLIRDAKRGDFDIHYINNNVRRNLYLKYKLGLNY